MEDESSHSPNVEAESSPSALTGRRRQAQQYAQAESHLMG
jgi:hypothetical protein